MKFWSQVDVTEQSSYAVLALPAGATPPPGVVHRTTRFGVDLFVPREDIERYVDEGGGPVGLWAYEALRIAAGRARLGFETDHRTIPHEIGWLETAVHLDKGCYRGQETVARVHNLGRPPRRLVLLHLDGSESELPPPGSPVTLDDREVGRVTSSARHYELGPIALAVVKRSTDADAALVAGGVAAGQEAVVAA
jgi:folate-binding protein YgfZ